MGRLCSIFLLLVPCVTAADDMYKVILNETWAIYGLADPECVAQSEFTSIIEDLAMTDLINVEADFPIADTDSSECIDIDEGVAYVEGKSSSDRQKLIDRFLNKPEGIELGEAPAQIRDARASTSFVIDSPRAPTSVFAGTRSRLKAAVCALVSVDCAAITITCLPQPTTVSRRQLSTGAGAGSRITFQIYTADQASADAAVTTLEAEMPTPAAATSTLGIEVSSYTLAAQPTPGASGVEYTLKAQTLPVAGGALLLLLGVATCVAASCIASGERRREDRKSQGCCKTGCCSSLSSSAWAAGSVLAACFLSAGMLLLYVRLDDPISDIKCIFHEISYLKTSTPEAKSSMEEIPTDIVNSIETYVDLFRVGILVPGGLLIFFLLLSACTGLQRCHCCTKISTILGNLVAILALVCYASFVGIAVGVSQPSVQDKIRLITGTCDSNLPTLAQAANDAQAILDKGRDNPGAISAAELSDLQSELDEQLGAYNSLNSLCDCNTDLFNGFPDLFSPGAVAVAAILLSFFVLNGECCATMCRPEKSVQTGTKTSGRPISACHTV